jgi:hypothetical protein
MRKVGSKGAPSAADFKESAKTAKKPKKGKWWLTKKYPSQRRIKTLQEVSPNQDANV